MRVLDELAGLHLSLHRVHANEVVRHAVRLARPRPARRVRDAEAEAPGHCRPQPLDERALADARRPADYQRLQLDGLRRLECRRHRGWRRRRLRQAGEPAPAGHSLNLSEMHLLRHDFLRVPLQLEPKAQAEGLVLPKSLGVLCLQEVTRQDLEPRPFRRHRTKLQGQEREAEASTGLLADAEPERARERVPEVRTPARLTDLLRYTLLAEAIPDPLRGQQEPVPAARAPLGDLGRRRRLPVLEAERPQRMTAGRLPIDAGWVDLLAHDATSGLQDASVLAPEERARAATAGHQDLELVWAAALAHRGERCRRSGLGALRQAAAHLGVARGEGRAQRARGGRAGSPHMEVQALRAEGRGLVPVAPAVDRTEAEVMVEKVRILKIRAHPLHRGPGRATQGAC
mmetsp:Transcript_8861/g.25958  ORF Transcript_8861/g.25958 Transcript_8861/m.25958 type:complete len:401 (-) Transcript_8861:89-1291(-)